MKKSSEPASDNWPTSGLCGNVLIFMLVLQAPVCGGMLVLKKHVVTDSGQRDTKT